MPLASGAVEESPEEAVARPVCLAFQLGWDMSRLYAIATIHRSFKYKPGTKLQSQRDFGTLHTERRLAAVSSGLQRMAGAFKAAGLERPTLTPLLSTYMGGGSKDEVREAVYRLHVATLITTQAADPRLGSAYNLGRALADTAIESDLDVLRERFTRQRVNGLREELAQLASSFPAHAARAVSQSLCVWQCALAPRFKNGATGKGPAAALPRQAEVWRGLLSGERLPSDRLEVEDYQRAAKQLVGNSSNVAWDVLRAYRLALLIGLAVVVAGVAVAIAVGGAVAVIAGTGAAASALGISWKGVASTFSTLAANLRAPLWGAELDLAIAEAITLPEAHAAYDELPVSAQCCLAR
jgi:hypothetical protein